VVGVGWPRETHIKLPALDVLASVLVGNDDDELGDFAADHPLVELGHDLLDVGSYLVIGRDEHVEAIFLDGCKVFGRVDAALEEDSMYGVLEKLGDELCAALEGELVDLGLGLVLFLGGVLRCHCGRWRGARLQVW
jgi:hypothetical protein